MGVHESSTAAAARLLRALHTGVLLYDGTPEPVRLVLDPLTGRPVLPVSGRVFDADEHVLHLPGEGEGALQLLVIPEEVDPNTDPGADRWRIYHGEAREPKWSRFAIDCARLGRAVIDGAELMQPNHLITEAEALLRRAGADPSRLSRAISAATGRDVASPVPVGVDPMGMDIRARFEIIRLEFADPVIPGSGAAERAAAQIDLLLSGAPEHGA